MIAAIILAAGASTRLGTPKQLALLAGETLLERSIRTASDAGLAPIIVVLPPRRPDLLPRSPHAPCLFVENGAAAEGMASSIRAGITAAQAVFVDGTVILACDQPAVTAAHLRRLASSPLQITASRYAGRTGVPACFPGSTFSQLLDLHGDQGARDLLRDAPALDLPDGDLDVDTPAELARAREQFEDPDRPAITEAAQTTPPSIKDF